MRMRESCQARVSLLGRNDDTADESIDDAWTRCWETLSGLAKSATLLRHPYDLMNRPRHDGVMVANGLR